MTLVTGKREGRKPNSTEMENAAKNDPECSLECIGSFLSESKKSDDDDGIQKFQRMVKALVDDYSVKRGEGRPSSPQWGAAAPVVMFHFHVALSGPFPMTGRHMIIHVSQTTTGIDENECGSAPIPHGSFSRSGLSRRARWSCWPLFIAVVLRRLRGHWNKLVRNLRLSKSKACLQIAFPSPNVLVRSAGVIWEVISDFSV